MSTIFTKSAQTATPGASPDPVANATAARNSEQKKRWFGPRSGDKAQRFALTLKNNLLWLKRFLHGGR